MYGNQYEVLLNKPRNYILPVKYSHTSWKDYNQRMSNQGWVRPSDIYTINK